MALAHSTWQAMLTDYPDEPLVKNLELNVDQNVKGSLRSVVSIAVRFLSYVVPTHAQLFSGLHLGHRHYWA